MIEIQPWNTEIEQLVSRLANLVEQEKQLHGSLTVAGRRFTESQRSVEASFKDVRTTLQQVQANGGNAHGGGPITVGGVSAPPNPYDGLVRSLKETVVGVTPAGSTVLVVSRGDPRLIQIDERRGWHFPRDESGSYAGYHPANSTAAISHLEELQGKGAQYLVFPSTAFWWLDYYRDLADYLETRCRRAWRDDACAIYELSAPIDGPLAAAPPRATNWLADLILGGA